MIGSRKLVRRVWATVLCLVLSVSLGGCGDRASRPESGDAGRTPSKSLAGQLSEVAPPRLIQELRPFLEKYQPQVSILSPRADQVLQDDRVTVQLQVKDLPIYKDEQFGLGPHLHVILDNQPYQAVYDPSEPLVFEDLEPGTHTLRVFASRPWHESFKNEGAYAQTTFHVFTQTPNNHPSDNEPLLSYSRPKGEYGAEPIMLDFYLRNAPLHFVARQDPKDAVADWRIRCTINGESFVFDRWQPIYLKGFKPGKNWLKLEFLDEAGNVVANAFNSTARVITYEPGGQDTLSKLMRNELSVAEVRRIVDPNYEPTLEPVEPSPTPEPPEPTVSPVPEAVESPAIAPPELIEPTPIPELEPTPTPSEAVEQPEPDRAKAQPDVMPMPEPKPESQVQPEPSPSVTPTVPAPVVSPDRTETPEAETTEPNSEASPSPKRNRFFDRFRRSQKVAPEPVPTETPQTLPEIIETPAAEFLEQPSGSPESVEPEPPPAAMPSDEPIEALPSETVSPAPSPATQPARSGGLLERFRQQRRTQLPPQAAPQTLPEVIEAPDLDSVESEVEAAPDLELKAQSQPEAEALGSSEAGMSDLPESDVPSAALSPAPSQSP